MLFRPFAGALLALLLGSGASVCAASLPRVDHVVVVIEENKALQQIVGNRSAPYLNRLANEGALFTNSHAITHPSLPNYFALFAGLTNDNGDGCPPTGISSRAVNLGSELIAAHRTFIGFAESLPEPGWTGCAAGDYGRKHAPWVEFTSVPRADSLPYSALPAFDRLPTVSFVIPNVQNDMHDGTIAQGDAWLRERIDPLVRWAWTHRTLLVVTWDEDDGTDVNRIPTIFVGPMVRAGRYRERIDHFRVLRTMEDLYGLPHAGRSGAVAPIVDCWTAARP